MTVIPQISAFSKAMRHVRLAFGESIVAAMMARTSLWLSDVTPSQDHHCNRHSNYKSYVSWRILEKAGSSFFYAHEQSP